MTFRLQQTVPLTEIDSTGYVYEHKKTKAKVFYIANEDTNKTFSIAFATPPYNDNGIAHILEHSVLCGSRKYPTKEPFVELLKGSLNTFLNAMTYSDKTIYPVSSQNDKDFYHLSDVYLDAVFFPKLVENPKILQQEGWHYHLETPEDDLTYSGVVYNEMKGVFSDPQQVINRAIQAGLYPDTIYAHESGGDPLVIPTLTQEEFLNFHQTYYHPSNSYTVLYGKLNIEEQLHHLEEYFGQFDYREIDNQLHYQEPFKEMKTLELAYSISREETLDNKTFLGLDFVVGESKDTALYIQFSILSDILLGSNAAPLYKNLMAAGISSDVIGSYDDNCLQSSFSVLLKNSTLEHIDTFKQIVFDTLQHLVTEGIPHSLLVAAINKVRFYLKEASQGGHPKGVLYAISTTDSALYGGAPFSQLLIEEHINFVEEHPEVLTQLIQHCLLHNKHALLTIATPKPQLNDDTFEAVHQTLQQYKQSLSPTEISQLVEQTQALIRYQTTPDSAENLATIPLLTLADLDTQVKPIDLHVETDESVTYLHYPVFTSGIDYISGHFNVSHLSIEELQYASLISHLLGQLPTTHYTIETLTTKIDSHTGGISFATRLFNESTKEQRFYPNFVIKGKAFTNKVDTLLEILKEVLLETQFNHAQKLKEQLLRLKTRLEAQYAYQGHVVAFSRLRTYFSQAAKWDDVMNGITFYQFISNLLMTFEEMHTTIIGELERVFSKLFKRQHLFIGFIGTNEDYRQHALALKTFTQVFDAQPMESLTSLLPLSIENEGWAIATDVQYVAQGYNVSLDGLAYDSRLAVLKNVLSLNYLWNKVRVQGGAYGAFMQISRDGDVIFLSYRDPHIEQTIEAYQSAGQFVETLDLDSRELTKAIIGTISELDTPHSPRHLGETAFSYYRLGITTETLQKERAQILNTTVDDLRALAHYINTAMTKQARCVIGNKTKLEQCSSLLDSVQTLID